MIKVFAERRDKLRKLLAEENLAGLFVTHAANRFYLSGFELHDPQCNESAGQLLILRDGRDYLLTDPRYLDAARRVWPEEDIFIYRGARLDQTRAFLKDKVKGELGFESQAMSVDAFERLSEGMSMSPVRGLVEKLRLVKEPFEIEIMERSCRLNHLVMERVPELLQPGRDEKSVSWDVEKLFRENGAQELAFPNIIAFGPNAALPHAIPGLDRLPESGPVLVDVGGRVDDYCSDQTRTFWVGETKGATYDKFRRTLDLVREAQTRAISVIRPGLSVSALYEEARGFFEIHAVQKRFTHALGHGLGLETHEPPSLAPTCDTTLAPGMIITIEPGLYYPDWGGVRWEHEILVTEDRARIL